MRWLFYACTYRSNYDDVFEGVQWKLLDRFKVSGASSTPTFTRTSKQTFNFSETADNIKQFYMRWAGHVARMEEGRGVHKVLVGEPEGKRPLGRPRRRWEDNIKMVLKELGRGFGDWMGLAQDRDSWRALVSTVMNFRVP